MSRLPVYCPESTSVRSSSPPKRRRRQASSESVTSVYRPPRLGRQLLARLRKRPLWRKNDRSSLDAPLTPEHDRRRQLDGQDHLPVLINFSAAVQRKRHTARMVWSRYARRQLIRHRIERHLCVRRLHSETQGRYAYRYPERQRLCRLRHGTRRFCSRYHLYEKRKRYALGIRVDNLPGVLRPGTYLQRRTEDRPRRIAGDFKGDYIQKLPSLRLLLRLRIGLPGHFTRLSLTLRRTHRGNDSA